MTTNNDAEYEKWKENYFRYWAEVVEQRQNKDFSQKPYWEKFNRITDYE
jgi:hypothetical protein